MGDSKTPFILKNSIFSCDYCYKLWKYRTQQASFFMALPTKVCNSTIGTYNIKQTFGWYNSYEEIEKRKDHIKGQVQIARKIQIFAVKINVKRTHTVILRRLLEIN